MVDATSLASADASKIASLLQSTQESEDGSESLGAPAGNVYEGKSGGIIETMQDLHEKAEGQLAEARATETKAPAEGDFSVTSSDLAEDEKALSTLHHDC